MAADKVNTEQDYRDNVQWAKGTIGKNQSKAGYNLNINDLCKDAVCQQEVATPSQSRYHNTPSSMKGDARRYSGTNEQSQAVTTSFNKGRPTIDPNDGAYHAALGYQNDAYNISHGISSKYHDCDKGLRCDMSSTTRTCSLPTNTPVQCNITPYVKSVSRKIVEHTVTLSGTPPFTVTLPNKAATITKIRSQGELLTLGRLDVGTGGYPYYIGPTTALHFAINNTIIGSAPLQKKEGRCSAKKCPYQINSAFSYTGKAQPLIVGVVATVKGLRKPFLADIDNRPLIITTLEERAEMGYRNSCGALLPECQQVSSQCVEGKETRVINGLSVTQDCWKEQKTYHCNTANTCTSLSACAIQSTACKTQLAGVCIEHTQTRLCETQQCQDVGLVCGADSFSLSGDYYDPSATRSSDFTQAAAGLAAVGEAGQDVKDATNINENSEIIFKGDAMSCSIKAAGISNCCKDSGWGSDIGIASCSEEEKALGTAKEDKLTVSLGRYCAEKVLGICIREKKAYCTFGSKLARIVQEAGRAQLNMDFGSAKHPDCRAFSPNELQKIDMSQMDFSDFFEDLHDGMITPDVSEIQNRLQQSVKQGGS